MQPATRWDYSLLSLCSPTAKVTLYDPDHPQSEILWTATIGTTPAIRVEAVEAGIKCRF